jgi:murein DD-endopeptidase MepM/ murein hydrolase activator NlpD
MLKTTIDKFLKTRQARLVALRDRTSQRLAARSRQVVAVATLAGVATIGLAAATLDNAPHPALSTASVASERSAAENQAARSVRESLSPLTTTETPAAPSTPAQTLAAGAPTTAPSEPAPAPEAKKAPDWVNPMPRGQISSCFGPRWGTMHEGIDFFTDAGEPIQSVGAGTVFAAGWVYSGYGISVVVDHGNGYLTHYAHMQKAAVSVGQKVKPGDVLGYEGSTGDSTGPHLHFEVHAGMWNQIDPAPWLRDHGVPISGC